MHEEPAKHVVRHTPEGTVIASDDLPELYPERRGVYKRRECVKGTHMNSAAYM